MRREFTDKTKALAFQRANGRCEECGARLTVAKFDYDHVIPDWLGGSNELGNCCVVCKSCHNAKTHVDISKITKTRHVHSKHIGARKSKQPFRGWRRFDGTPVFAKDRA